MIREAAALVIAFAFIAMACRKKVNTGAALIIGSLLLGACAGHAPTVIADNLLKVVTTPRTLKTIFVIVQIGILGALMKHYGILEGLLGALRKVFPSSKAIIMLMPFAIGLVSVPGGAGISSPFVDEVGKTLGLPVQSRAAINLLFRHIAMFLLPTSNSMIILAAAAPDFNLYRLIALDVLFVAITEGTAYLLYLRKIPDVRSGAKPQALDGLWGIFKYLSPIYIIITLNGIFGLEMYLSGLSSLALILVFWGRRDPIAYARVLWSGFKAKTLVLMLGIYFMQNTVRDLGATMDFISRMFNGSVGMGTLLVIAFSALMLGLISGLSYLAIGVITPLIVSLSLPPMQELVYIFFAYAWSFIGYFYSPLHLCQVLTLAQMECPISRLDRAYVPQMVQMAVTTFALFALYWAVLVR